MYANEVIKGKRLEYYEAIVSSNVKLKSELQHSYFANKESLITFIIY